MTQNQAKILKKNEDIAQPSPPPSKATEKALQKTTKETYVEIAKIESLMTQQLNKLDN
jgi:hypothetical protein